MNSFKEDIFIGIVVLLFSIIVLIISFTIPNNENRTNYKETTGYLIDYNEKNTYDETIFRDEGTPPEETIYTLIYSYVVDNHEYTVSSSITTGILPKMNSTRIIKYNPNNPSEAFIPSLSSISLFTFLGIFGIVISLIVISYTIIKNITDINLKNRLTIILKIIVSLVVIILGFAISYVVTGYFSLIKMFSFYTNDILPSLILSIAFILAGIITMIITLINYIKSKRT